MRFNKFMAAGGALLFALSATPGDAYAAPGQGKAFGKGAPFEIKDLPPGRVRAKLESLPAPARERAMSWLHSFTFPEADLESIRIDSGGGVYYVDSVLPDAAQAAAAQVGTAAGPTVAAIAPADAFRLHSRPGASKVVYLDFNGHTITGTAWNAEPNVADTLVARSFDLDGDPTTFSTDERNKIAEIWHRVAEDYAPFDIDITTEEPVSFGPTVARVLFTHSYDAYGNPLPDPGAGGIAYVGVWGRADFYSTYSPALVYYNNTSGGGYAPHIAEIASHELGHNLYLAHDGRTTPPEEYYAGHGSGNVSWAPIMGNMYNGNVTQWSKGEYALANNPQDDLLELSSRLTYRPDDHGNSISGAPTQLQVDATGNVLVTTPETDPTNANPANKGVIETSGDVDMFYFDAAAGPVNLVVKPAWAAFYRTTNRGANLDIQVLLINQSGQTVATSDPTDDTQAIISTTVSAGRYYLRVEGVGNSATPYSDYASLGQYYISGSIGVTAAAVSSPVPGSVLVSDSVTFQWNNTGGSQYWLYVGTSIGASDIHNSNVLPAGTTSRAIANLPTNGGTLYVRLWTLKPDGTWLWNDYTYTAALAAAISSPVPGSTLSSSTATFQWNSTANPGYMLLVGTTLGGYDIHSSGLLAAGTTSRTVTGLPTNGSTVYVRLLSQQPAGTPWLAKDYTYQAYRVPADTGYKSPTINVADSGGDNNGYQGTPANAYAADGLFATDSSSGTNTSVTWTDAGKDRHRFFNFGMSIPSGSAIRGVELQLKAKVDGTTGSPKIYAQLSWDGGTTWTTVTRGTPTLSTTNTVYTLGSSADTWGRTWAAGDFDNTKFRVRLVDVAGSTSRTFSLDSVAVKVYH